MSNCVHVPPGAACLLLLQLWGLSGTIHKLHLPEATSLDFHRCETDSPYAGMAVAYAGLTVTQRSAGIAAEAPGPATLDM